MEHDTLLYVTLPLTVMWLLANRPHQRYLRPRLVAVLGCFAVTGVVGALLPSPAGLLVALAAVLPLNGQNIALRRCAGAAAAHNGELLAQRVRTLRRWSWPVPLIPPVLIYGVHARDLGGPAPEPFAVVATQPSCSPAAALWAARERGDAAEYEALARSLLDRHHGPAEQAAAIGALARCDLDAALRWWASPAARRARAYAPLSALGLLAAAGRETDVATLGRHSGAHDTTLVALVGEARLAAGADVASTLQWMRSEGDAGRRAADQFTRLPVRPPTPLSEEAGAELHRLADGVRNSVHAWGRDRGRWQPRVTWMIAGVLSIVFAVQLVRGFDEQTLYDMGAYVTGDAPSEWWRNITAAVLHGSVEHFVFNAVALLSLGRLAEARVPRPVYVFTWVAASVLSFALFGPLDRTTLPGLAVGASGGVMGLLGLALSVFIVNQVRVPSAVNRRLLVVFGLLTVVQLVMDQFVPNVAWQAHLIGLAVGFVAGLLQTLAGPPARRRTPGRGATPAPSTPPRQ